jgi:hypothetical protein
LYLSNQIKTIETDEKNFYHLITSILYAHYAGTNKRKEGNCHKKKQTHKKLRQKSPLTTALILPVMPSEQTWPAA